MKREEMANRVHPSSLVIQNENFEVHHRKASLDGSIKSSKTAAKKGGVALRSRKALNDVTNNGVALGNRKALNDVTNSGVALGNRKALNNITNKTSLHQEALSQKKNTTKKESNVTEEMFLHDHKKCIGERQAARNDTFWLDMVVPGHDTVPAAKCFEANLVKADPDSPCCYSKLEELSMPQFSAWFQSPRCNSPPFSPTSWDSSPPSPLSWQFEEVEFLLKQEYNV